MLTRYFKKVLFQKQNTFFSKAIYSFSDTANPYSYPNHTLMKNIFIFKQEEGYCNHSENYNYLIIKGYIIKDQATNSLICVDPGKYDVAVQNIKIMEQSLQSKLTHILCTHNYHRTQDVEKFLKYNDKIKIVAGNKGQNVVFHNQDACSLGEFKVGDLLISFLHTPGHTSDSFSISVSDSAEMQQPPIVFTGETLLMSDIGDIQEDKQYKQMANTLEYTFKVEFLDDNTLVFPAKDGLLENLLFAKSLDPGNPVINLKIALAQAAIEKKAHILPSSILEEKNCNPYLRLFDKQIQRNLDSRTLASSIKELKEKQAEFIKDKKLNPDDMNVNHFRKQYDLLNQNLISLQQAFKNLKEYFTTEKKENN